MNIRAFSIPLSKTIPLNMKCHGRHVCRVQATTCRFFLCHGFGIEPRPSFSSEDGETPRSDLDNKRVVILEIQSRRMKASLRGNHSFDTNPWKISMMAGESLVEPKGKGDEDDGKGEEEEFFSVKSCFSHCSSEDGAGLMGLHGRPGVFDEFRHCEGWPFGLCRRLVMLPPLPRSPSDSWTWRKRNLMAKAL